MVASRLCARVSARNLTLRNGIWRPKSRQSPGPIRLTSELLLLYVNPNPFESDRLSRGAVSGQKGPGLEQRGSGAVRTTGAGGSSLSSGA